MSNKKKVGYKVDPYDAVAKKQTGSYKLVTMKESFSRRDYSNRGKVGCKTERQTSTISRFWHKGGYIECIKQQKFIRVDYGGSSSNSSSSTSGKKGYNKNSGGGGKKHLH